jgi:pilus assembly protein Flp/PilA
VSAEHLAAPSAVKADHEISAIGSVDGNSRLSDHWDLGASPKLGQGAVDDRDKVWEIANSHGVVRNVAANNLGDETAVDRLRFSHRFLPISITNRFFKCMRHGEVIKIHRSLGAVQFVETSRSGRLACNQTFIIWQAFGWQAEMNRQPKEGTQMFVTLIKLWNNEDGATAIEYGLIAALIAVAAIAAMQLVGTSLTSTFNNVASKL